MSNGSTLTHLFGADERTGLLGKANLASGLLLMVEAYAFATGGLEDAVYNFDLDHWGFSRRRRESLGAFLLRLADSRFLAGRDNACYSLTLHGAHADNAVWKTYRGTYYFSHVTVQTEKSWLSGHHYPSPRMNVALLPHAAYIGRKQFDRPPIPAARFRAEDWWENDGAVPTHSQRYPHVSGITQVPFFKFSADKAEVKKAEGKLGVSLARLNAAKEALSARVAPFVADFVKNVDI